MKTKSFNSDLLRGGEKNDEEFRLRGGRGTRGVGGKTGRISARLDSRMRAKPGRAFGAKAKPPVSEPHGADPRQRVIVKTHYYKHAGGGGAALRAHGAYIERESAKLEPETAAHADYLSREGRQGFYDAGGARMDGRERLAAWSRDDARHFRIVLSPENGQAIGDLAGYTREVMARAEGELGRPLQWVAVNHWDTDNPHAHIVLRGRDGTGKPLSLPDQFIKHQFREIARDVATERIGPRAPDEARRSLVREVRAHRVTSLDKQIAEKLDLGGKVRMADLARGAANPALAAALQARATELARMGLAEEVKRGHFVFGSDWRERLRAMEAHVDIRRARFAREREGVPGRTAREDRKAEARGPETARAGFERAAERLSQDAGKPCRGLGQTMQTWTVRGEIELPSGKYLALERHDRVALAPKPRGLAVSVGDKVSAGIKNDLARIVRGIGIDR